MEYRNDTICAVSTPPGTSGIAVIRISGADAVPTVQSIFKSKSDLSKAKSHSIHFGRIVDQGKVIDDVLISVFLAPNSYTGEDVIEISCHGNTFISGLIMELLLQKIRMAEPGEFTQRAFFNDKIGLTQSEAVGDLLHVQTRRSHQAAILQLEGNLRRRIEKIL
ncbi:MAG: tRNA uridine-5-carboxymethylaminomethyl(34) synthesis GTPase MnmE, partial [Candidatus Cloacimonetes bacterium]|nr:tRNA uridine-5-carboxymethylaminomethyl(34) synthesis GTPase MnmE [Candidatus Cloacimonadota bacterium]